VNSSGHIIRLVFSADVMEQGLLPAKLFARVLDMLPPDTKVTGVSKSFSAGHDAMGGYSADDDREIAFRLESFEFALVDEAAVFPELLVEFTRSWGCPIEDAQIHLIIDGKAPHWVRNPEPVKPPVPDYRTYNPKAPVMRGHDPRAYLRPPAEDTCQCDVAYIGGHWPHCAAGKRGRR
jgi:hypothetical protein